MTVPAKQNFLDSFAALVWVGPAIAAALCLQLGRTTVSCPCHCALPKSNSMAQFIFLFYVVHPTLRPNAAESAAVAVGASSSDT